MSILSVEEVKEILKEEVVVIGETIYIVHAAEEICRIANERSAEHRMHWTSGIVRRFKQFPVVKFFLSLWHSLASRQ